MAQWLALFPHGEKKVPCSFQRGTCKFLLCFQWHHRVLWLLATGRPKTRSSSYTKESKKYNSGWTIMCLHMIIYSMIVMFFDLDLSDTCQLLAKRRPVSSSGEEDATLPVSYKETAGLVSVCPLYPALTPLPCCQPHTKRASAQPCSTHVRSTFHNMGTLSAPGCQHYPTQLL